MHDPGVESSRGKASPIQEKTGQRKKKRKRRAKKTSHSAWSYSEKMDSTAHRFCGMTATPGSLNRIAPRVRPFDLNRRNLDEQPGRRLDGNRQFGIRLQKAAIARTSPRSLCRPKKQSRVRNKGRGSDAGLPVAPRGNRAATLLMENESHCQHTGGNRCKNHRIHCGSSIDLSHSTPSHVVRKCEYHSEGAAPCRRHTNYSPQSSSGPPRSFPLIRYSDPPLPCRPFLGRWAGYFTAALVRC